jgi:hypothetical protein
MATANRAVPVAVTASESAANANTTMPNPTIVGQLARMPLLVLFHDTFEAFLSCDDAPLNEPDKIAEAAQETRSNNVTDSNPATSRM